MASGPSCSPWLLAPTSHKSCPRRCPGWYRFLLAGFRRFGPHPPGEPGDWPSQGGKPSRSDRLSGEGAKGLRSQRGFPLVRVHGGQSREVVDTRRRVVLHSTSKDLVAEQIQQVQDGRANGLPSP